MIVLVDADGDVLHAARRGEPLPELDAVLVDGVGVDRVAEAHARRERGRPAVARVHVLAEVALGGGRVVVDR